MEQVVFSAELNTMEFSIIVDEIIELLGMKIVEESGYGDKEVRLTKKDYVLGSDDI